MQKDMKSNNNQRYDGERRRTLSSTISKRIYSYPLDWLSVKTVTKGSRIERTFIERFYQAGAGQPDPNPRQVQAAMKARDETIELSCREKYHHTGAGQREKPMKKIPSFYEQTAICNNKALEPIPVEGCQDGSKDISKSKLDQSDQRHCMEKTSQSRNNQSPKSSACIAPEDSSDDVNFGSRCMFLGSDSVGYARMTSRSRQKHLQASKHDQNSFIPSSDLSQSQHLAFEQFMASPRSPGLWHSLVHSLRHNRHYRGHDM